MAVVKVNRESSIRLATWYPSYQQQNFTISLPSDKFFGITKRVANVDLAQILNKATHIRAIYSDVNNDQVPYGKTFVTGTADITNAHRGDANFGYNSTLANGANITQDVSLGGATTNDIVSHTRKGVLINGQFEFFNGLNINVTIPSNGTVRFSITNSSGNTINLANALFYVHIFKPASEIAQNFYNYGIRKGTLVFSEFVENGIPPEKTEEIYAGVYAIMVTNEGVTSPEETNLFGDYYEVLNGYSTDKSFNAAGETQSSLEAGLASQSGARGNSLYYINNAFNYRNRIIGGYFDGIRKLHNGIFIHETFYNLEKAFMAMDTRKTCVFGWGSFEGVDGYIENRATEQRLKFNNGDLIRTVRVEGSFQLTEIQLFLSLVIGNGEAMWHDGGQYGTNLACFDVSYIGGYDPNKDHWQSPGQGIVPYNENDPNQVKKVCAPGQSGWSDTAAPSHNGAASGAKLYSEIQDRLTTLKFAIFNYEENGTIKSGYFNGNIPVSGSLGNASVTRRGNVNYGQNNIVKQRYSFKPIVLEGHGSGGTCIIIIHPTATLTGSKQYNISTSNFGDININHVGVSMAVFKVN